MEELSVRWQSLSDVQRAGYDSLVVDVTDDEGGGERRHRACPVVHRGMVHVFSRMPVNDKISERICHETKSLYEAWRNRTGVFDTEGIDIEPANPIPRIELYGWGICRRDPTDEAQKTFKQALASLRRFPKMFSLDTPVASQIHQPNIFTFVCAVEGAHRYFIFCASVSGAALEQVWLEGACADG